eukprot:CAMPEP_0119315304 /NCGR_PEP_ID=MMETSP1333-20130426/35251_1 /TAXON_ID=418940 /ORGANISM="Scyphosphaera apsteinii, Strain RCC1455" /LENGTH=295 /DNA_ID=CAMNT_0007320619 /DNA_START=29 /DNA_END=913 /DNA_ORIENTATION=-
MSVSCLTALSDELILYILEDSTARHEWHCSLCRLEQVCWRFRSPAAISFDDQEQLSLPERAAQRRIARATSQPVRPDGLQPIRPYQRAAGEGHRHVLQLLECGLLTRGVLHNVPVSAVERSGWSLAYCAEYKQRTRDADLDKVPASARYVLVAAVRRGRSESVAASSSLFERLILRQRPSSSEQSSSQGSSSSSFALLAWGKRQVVLRVTHDESFHGFATTTSNEEESVFWYRWTNHSFGFSSDPSLWLWAADAAIKQIGREACSEDRLSWNLDLHSTGGWRAGTVIDLGSSSEW